MTLERSKSMRTQRICLRGLTFELTGALRQGGLARLAKMYRVPPSGPRRPAVARPVERVVRFHWIQYISKAMPFLRSCETISCFHGPSGDQTFETDS